MIHQVVSQIKGHDELRLHPLHKLDIVRLVLSKYEKQYSIRRGYVNMEFSGVPVCCTYFWLEGKDGEKLDVMNQISPIFENYFLTDQIIPGSECIDDRELDITHENNYFWKLIGSDDLYDKYPSKVRNDIISKHPQKKFLNV